MFKITPIENQTLSSKVLLKGASIGYYDSPLKFDFSSDLVPNPVELSIIITKKSDEPSGILMSDIIIEGDTARAILTIKNPPELSSTNVQKTPIAYLPKANTWLSITFVLVSFANTTHFLFYYEFYDEIGPLPLALAPNQTTSTEAPV
jgi:hypothetical protein